jgi:hypothetical protein
MAESTPPQESMPRNRLPVAINFLKHYLSYRKGNIIEEAHASLTVWLHFPSLNKLHSHVHREKKDSEERMDGWHTRARICNPFKEPSRNRFPAWQTGTTTLFFVPARQASWACGIDSWPP